MKFKNKHLWIVRSVIMAFGMTFIMSMCITFINMGFVDNFVELWMDGFRTAFLVAVPVSLMLSRVVSKIIPLIVEQ